MSKIKDCIYGFVIGDAMGVPIEFESREKLIEHPITSMHGYGSYDVPEGTWSDDSSMTLATMDSIINKNEIDLYDIMMNFYYWLQKNRYTATGEVFDAGRTCIQSIITFSKYLDPLSCGQTSIDTNGNGSLMRISPLVLFIYYKKINIEDIYKLVKDVSSLTHAHEISVMACYIYTRFLLEILDGKDKFSAYNLIQTIDYSKYFSNDTIKEFERIINKDISKLDLDEINSSGYVLDTLEAALWIVLKTNKYTESIIGAINLGGDTDTIGAITGSIAGVLYGFESMPDKWTSKIKNKEYLLKLIEKFENTIGV